MAASSSRTITIKFDGTAKGLVAASVEASRAIKGIGGDTSGLKKAQKDLDAFGNKLDKTATNTKKEGQLLGGALALGISTSAPLVSAALVGGVALGLIGVAVAVQKNNAKVKQSFGNLKDQVVTEMTSATNQVVPYLVKSGHALQQEFANLGPQLDEAFKYAGPDITILTNGVDRLADNAMPGLVTSMRNSKPVVQGISNILGDLGTTATTVLDAVSGHSVQFGRDLSQVGVLIQNVGGVAAGVLPGLASGFGGTVGALNTLLTALKPIAPTLGTIAGEALPVVGMFKLFGAAGGLLDGAGEKFTAWGGKVATSEGKATGLSKTLGTVGKFLGGVGGALPIVGAAFGVFSDVVAANDQKLQGWAQDLIAGGQAAKTAFTAIVKADVPDQPATTGKSTRAGFEQASPSASSAKSQLDTLAGLKDVLSGTTEGLTAQQKALVVYNAAQNDSVLGAGQLTQAQKDLTKANNDAAAAQDRQNRQLLSANQLLLADTKAVLDNEEAQLNLSDAQHAVTDAQSNYDAVVKKSGRNSQAAQEAANQLGHALDSEVKAAGAAAAAADKKGGADQKAADAARAQREEVVKLVGQYAVSGQAIPAALRNIANGLGVATNAAGVTAGQFDNVRAKLAGIPAGKKITVNALTSQAVTELQDMGYRVTHLPNGKFTVSANVKPATNSLDSVVNRYNGKRINFVVTTSGDVRPSGTKIEARAKGGPIVAGRPYVVGDGGGPEIFVSDQSGRVIGTRESADILAGSSRGREIGGDTFDLVFADQVLLSIIDGRLRGHNRTLVSKVKAGAGAR